jgi:L-ascorbate metabolism protein UlaG (beta-lactamase superfamily)
MDVRLTHVGGPTVLIEVGGWRLLTDPTFDPAGADYSFGLGTGSTKLAGPAIPAAEIGRIDAVLLSHDQHDDNLDPAGRALLPAAGTVVTTRGWRRGRRPGSRPRGGRRSRSPRLPAGTGRR